MTDHDKTIGRLEAHVDDLRTEVRAMREDIGELKALVEQGKGAKYALGILAAVIGALSSYASTALSVFRPGH